MAEHIIHSPMCENLESVFYALLFTVSSYHLADFEGQFVPN